MQSNEPNTEPHQSSGAIRDRVAAAYLARWGMRPDRVLFAPGRINLIGDHTDYSLLPVLPVAIQRGIAFAVGSAPRGITVDSLNEPGELVVGAEPKRFPSWHRYAEIALRPFCASTGGIRVLLAGDLPSTGGLSSSTALVVGLLAAISGNRKAGGREFESGSMGSETAGIERADCGTARLAGRALVEAAVDAERRAAIEGGAMDQTIIVFGEADAALRIDFDPTSVRAVPLPSDLVLIAAYSGEQAAKGAAARDMYNARVVGCRCAASLLASEIGRARPDPLVLGAFVDVPSQAIEGLPTTTTAAHVSERTHTPLAQLVGLAARDFSAEQEIPVRSVARHVLVESAAVDAAEQALRNSDLDRFGALLNASHQSLRSFGSSTAPLDRLTKAMLEAGALGARVTGAGFGGYAIAACQPDFVDRVLAAAHRATGGPAFRVTATRGIG